MRFFRLLVRILLLCIGLVFLISCGRDISRQSLADIESILDSSPDSALALIRQIDTASLRGKAAKAKFSLLHAIALDKNYIDTADTRVVQPAVDWYDRHGSPEQRLKAYMYLGTEQYNAGHYGEAIVTLTKALKSASDNENSYYTGILYARLAETYSMTRDYSQAGYYIDRSIETFKLLGRTDLELIETHKKAQNLVNVRKWEEAINLYYSLLERDGVLSPFREKVEADLAMALLTSPFQDETRAYELFSSVFGSMGRLGSENQYGAFAYTLQKKGFMERADSIMEGIASRCGKDNLYYSYWCHRMEKDKGDFKSAYYSLWSSMRSSDSLTTLRYEQSAANAQRAYLESKCESDARIIKDQRILLFLTTLLILFVLSLVGVLIKWKNDSARDERERTAMIIDSLESELARAEKEKEEYETRLGDVTRLKTKAKFELLAKLYEIVNIYTDGNEANLRGLYSRIKSLISSLNADGKAAKRFEETLNSESDNIMRRFRKDFPDLPEETYRLASYVFAGFDNTTIMLLLGESPSNTRSKKNRLVKRIAASSSDSRGLFLKYFPKKGRY